MGSFSVHQRNNRIGERNRQTLLVITENSHQGSKVFIRNNKKWIPNVKFSSFQLFSRVRLFATPLIAARQASLSIINSWSFLKLMPIKLVMPSSHLILCRPLLLLPSVPLSIRVFSNESTLCTRWPKYWSFSFNISPSNEHPGLISFRMDWLDLVAAQGTLKILLQHHSSVRYKSNIKTNNYDKILLGLALCGIHETIHIILWNSS